MSYTAPGTYLLEPINPTRELSDTIKEFDTKWRTIHSDKEDLLLYHYTNPVGLNGILASRSIWCGHASYFNDPHEIEFGKGVICSVLEDLKKTSGEEIRSFLNALETTLESIFVTYRYDPYIACFSKTNNMLSQWRNYAAGGIGYSVGIIFSDATFLADSLDNLATERKPTLRRVIYDKDKQATWINTYLGSIIDAVKISRAESGTIHDKAWTDVEWMLAMQAVNHLVDMALCFKAPEFKEENEWRLIWITIDNFLPEKVGIRNSSILTPYRIAYLYNNTPSKDAYFPIKSICYGPAQEESIAKKTLDIITRHYEAVEHKINLNRNDVVIDSPGYRLR